MGTEDAWKINTFWNVETRPHTSTLDLKKKSKPFFHVSLKDFWGFLFAASLGSCAPQRYNDEGNPS